jgi:hypothetical protein
MRKFILLLILWASGLMTWSQGLLSQLERQQDSAKTRVPVLATFKTTRIINGHSIEIPGKGELMLIVGHRFGRLNAGPYEMFGLDIATIRLGVEYTMPFSGRLCVGLGRSTYKKAWDGFVKARVLKQTTGPRSMPLSLTLFAGMAITGLKSPDPTRPLLFTSRLSYAYQAMISRKFGDWVSLQLTPTVIHRNLVPLPKDQNTTFHLGIGGRFKVSRRISIMAEYYYPVHGQNFGRVLNQPILGPLAVGIDLETGGHVFQLQLTNGQAMFESGFVTETIGDWLKGDIHFGFNITRTFSFKKGAARQYKLKSDQPEKVK